MWGYIKPVRRPLCQHLCWMSNYRVIGIRINNEGVTEFYLKIESCGGGVLPEGHLLQRGRTEHMRTSASMKDPDCAVYSCRSFKEGSPPVGTPDKFSRSF